MLNLGQWAQSRYFGYPGSTLPIIERQRPQNPLEPLLVDAGAGWEPSQYTVSVSAIEIVRPEPFAGTPIPTRQDVLNTGQGVSQLQCKIEWSLGAGRDNQMFLDVGAGFELSLPASRVQISALLPAGAIDQDQAQGQLIPAAPPDPVTGGLAPAWNSVLIWGTVNRTGRYSGFSDWQLTRGAAIAANGAGQITIPQGADFVELYETFTPNAPVFVTFNMEGLGTPVIARLSYLTNQPFYTGRVRIPGNARFILIPAGNPAARLVTAIFTQRP